MLRPGFTIISSTLWQDAMTGMGNFTFGGQRCRLLTEVGGQGVRGWVWVEDSGQRCRLLTEVLTYWLVSRL